MNKKLFAFWNYSSFPYVLGSEIIEIESDGRAYAPAYQGWITPIKILPLAAGNKLKNKLEELTKAYNAEEAALKKKFNLLAKEITGI